MEQKIDLKQIEGVLDELAKVKGSLITILQKTQETYGYLPKEAIIYISERTGIAESEIMGVATFYTQFLPDTCGQVSYYALPRYCLPC